MNTSLFELFKIGIGPSSSHTVGPMRAALRFLRDLEAAGLQVPTERVTVDLYGSLALTGIGHGTDRAVLLGLMGESPETVDPATVDARVAEVRRTSTLMLAGRREIAFRLDRADDPAAAAAGDAVDLRFRRNQMFPEAGVSTHPNGMRFTALSAEGATLREAVFFSVGGGFIVSAGEWTAAAAGGASGGQRSVPYAFRSAGELLEMAAAHKRSIADLVLANECALLADASIHIVRPAAAMHASATPEERVHGSIYELWRTMERCAERGMATEGRLPGGLNVRRRAPALARRLAAAGAGDPLAALDWLTMWAMAVNEENAAGGRVVTAPTNGAAGVIPAVGLYFLRYVAAGQTEAERRAGLMRYFLTAAAIGILYKENASISGAEVGCQGEVGVACSMAAGGLVAAQGGSNQHVEHAAEVAMEHNLGMTCDPIGGLVQIPCIERNGMGAVKAINASRIAMHETEGHKLSLDQVIRTMYETGMDMQTRYKETSLAGLALNVIEC
ncbi:MAG: L-serine ammonia-lyase [Acidobacteriota bacterium]|nr:L-serine ammonia-lyase [Acidobacteriota bacterium]